MKTTEILFYVFWSYSDYPYVLGGAVTKVDVDHDGNVTSYYCPSYQMWIGANRVKFIINDKQVAQDYLDKLKSLRDEYYEEQKKLKETMKERALSAIPELKTCYEYS